MDNNLRRNILGIYLIFLWTVGGLTVLTSIACIPQRVRYVFYGLGGAATLVAIIVAAILSEGDILDGWDFSWSSDGKKKGH